MQLLKDSEIKSWQAIGNVRSVSTLKTSCPYCGDKVVFSVEKLTEDKIRISIAGSAECPSCDKNVFFWSVKDTTPVNGVGAVAKTNVYMHPAAVGGYAHPDLPANVPEPLQRALNSTIDSLNSRNFPATAVGARRTLEGIFKYLVAAEKRNKSLFQLIDEVQAHHDLAAPLKSLSHAIRSGGNLGAHFDDENEPTEPMARKMVELLDYLISYLYVLPSQITDLEAALAKE